MRVGVKNNVKFTKTDTLALKGIAICMMLFHHLFAFPERIPVGLNIVDISVGGYDLSYIIAAFCKMCVAVYIYLGGYGTFLSFHGAADRKKKLRQKVINLYLTYWEIVVIIVPISFVLKTNSFNITTFIKTLLGVSHAYCSEWWFFLPYVIVTIIYAFISKVFERQRCPCVDIVAVIVLRVLLAARQIYLPEKLLQFTPVGILLSGMDFLPGFLLGAISAKYSYLDKIKQYVIANSMNNMVSAFFAVGITLLIFWFRVQIGGAYDAILAALLVPMLSILLSISEKSTCNFVLISLGQKSTIMWLVHTFYCYQFLPRILFSLKIPLIIFSALVGISFVTAIPLEWLDKLVKAYLLKHKE